MAKQALMVPGLFKQNNFDLIRLIAAFQVVIVHAIEHLKVDSLLTLILALVSWRCIERPFLRKRKSFLYGR